MTSNHQAWNKLGMDLEFHDAMLNIVGTMYGSIYATQNNRPKKMDYFNQIAADIHGVRILELMKEQEKGRKVVGTFCVFIPEELTIAAGAIQIGLCAGAEIGYDEAEHYVPRNTCALIKSAFGFKLKRVCPYIEVSDLIVGENTCDGKKKAFESYSKLVRNFYMMDLPQTKSESGVALLKKEYERYAEKLEEITGNKITKESLKEAIRIVNNKRKALSRLATLRKANPAPISGLDVMLIQQIGFFDDPVRFTGMVNALCDELDERIKNGEGVAPKNVPRILLSGCPMAIPNWKLPNIIEKAGGIIVGEESCVGERGFRNYVEGDNLDAIAERYMKIDCAIFTPNESRYDHIKEMFHNYNADGVIHYSLQFCQPYTIESIAFEKQLEKEAIPTLSLETDYSQEDMGQLQTRIEAFYERIAK